MLGTLRRSILRIFQSGEPEVQLRAALRKAGKAVAVSEGKETVFYKATSTRQLTIKPGIRTRLAEDGQVGRILLMMDNGGSVTGIQRRCPKGFTGGCITQTSSPHIASCEGVSDPACSHPEISTTTHCGFFSIEVNLSSSAASKLFAG